MFKPLTSVDRLGLEMVYAVFPDDRSGVLVEVCSEINPSNWSDREDLMWLHPDTEIAYQGLIRSYSARCPHCRVTISIPRESVEDAFDSAAEIYPPIMGHQPEAMVGLANALVHRNVLEYGAAWARTATADYALTPTGYAEAPLGPEPKPVSPMERLISRVKAFFS